MKTKKAYKRDREFQDLTASINDLIIRNKGLVGDQKEQVELLFSLENKFKFYASKYPKFEEVYIKFIQKMTDGNILTAKPYFRERSGVFNDFISPALKNKDPKELSKYAINYQMIQYIVENWPGTLPVKVRHYYNEYLEARRILIENNLPLVINRAKIFFRKTPESHLSLTDLINIGVCGLANGIDKYVGEYSKQWRSTCIGYMSGSMIQQYSLTSMKLFPQERKILYRINSIKSRQQTEDLDELTRLVNESFQKDLDEGMSSPKLPISKFDIEGLLNGNTGNLSNDSAPPEHDVDFEEVNVYSMTADLTENVEGTLIENDVLKQVYTNIGKLLPIERKVLKLRGMI